MSQRIIIGAGVTGLAAGCASGLPVFEASERPGGICTSYYVRPGTTARLPRRPADDEAYHFEIGGGHWIFGGDPVVLRFIESLAPLQSYQRRSSVYFPERQLRVPYPLQNHLRYLGPEIAARAMGEMSRPASTFRTMHDWLLASFGPTLCEEFFFPFHQLYTAGLHHQIAPQDAYKSPVDLRQVIDGALRDAAPVGYNVTFVYPQQGLDALAGAMAARADVRYGKRLTRVDPQQRVAHFSDGTDIQYHALISTVPLNKMMELAGLAVESRPDPYTSVLVLNVGAVRGPRAVDDHWIYLPTTRSGFHRVGFYEAVDRRFLPASARSSASRVSLYIERAFPGGQAPSADEIAAYSRQVIEELQAWGFIEQVEVCDPTWIDVAYTWQWPGSKWRSQALQALAQHDIHQVGRYGRWIFQGIADSIRDGLMAGAAFKS